MSAKSAARGALVEPDRLEPFSAPREVDRVYGHDSAEAEFVASLQSGRLHHAWLLIGPDGVGKATLAYRLARMVLAHGTGGSTTEPVSAANPLFRKVAGLAHPNLLVIRRSWIEKTKRYSQWIGVNEVRRLRAFLGSTAGEATWRVVIVDRADQLNQNAANALLKALEEPPPNTLFLLVASAEGLLPVTIRSRTRVLRLPGLDEAPLRDAVGAALARDNVEADEQTLSFALALSEGSAGRALALISRDGITLYEEIAATFAALPELDGAKLQRQAEQLASPNEAERLELYLSLLLGVIQRLVRFGATGEGLVGKEQAFAGTLVSKDNIAAWADAFEAISKARTETFALNLDRGILVLQSWFHLRQVAQDFADAHNL